MTVSIEGSIREDGVESALVENACVGDRPNVPSYFSWYAGVHRCLAGMLLLVTAPLIAVLVVLVRLTSKGPGIYRQTRIGRHGNGFQMLKIRTMYHNVESETGPVWSAGKTDPRITTVGRVMRRLHLDELPQLWNVARGEMAIVGPRPERPEFVRALTRHIPNYLDRLTVLPGVTGLAQINLPPDTDLNCVRRKLVLDLEYAAQGNLFMDLRIMACTAGRMLGIPGYRTARLLGVRRKPAVATNGFAVSHFVTIRKAEAENADISDSNPAHVKSS